jgi:hypothetical protein
MEALPFILKYKEIIFPSIPAFLVLVAAFFMHLEPETSRRFMIAFGVSLLGRHLIQRGSSMGL